jgi:hypothetical protein
MLDRTTEETNPAEICETLPAAGVFILDVVGLCVTEIFDRCTAVETNAEEVPPRPKSLLTSKRSLQGMAGNRIILEREQTGTQAIWSWFDAVKAGSDFRFDASLLALDETASIVAQWRLHSCYPSKVHALPVSTASSSPAAVIQERIVLNFENLERLD